MAHQRDRLAIGCEPLDGAGEGIDAAGEEDDFVWREAPDVLAREVAKMVKFSVPPGYVRKKPPARPKLDPFILVIDGILLDDKSRPKKQQHTAKRIFERLRDECGFTGGITIVKDYV